MAPVRQYSVTRRSLVGAGGAFLAVGGAALALRGSGGGQRARVDAKTLNRGNAAEPDTLDPHLASTQYEDRVIGDLFMGLMTENAAGDPVPGASLDYDASADGLVYTFVLRPHDWSDGLPVTAEDFVYSFRRVLDPRTASQYAAILYPILNAEAVNAGHAPPGSLGVRALGPHTLEITFAIEVPYIAQLLTHFSTFPVPRHVVEKHGAAWMRPGIAVSNGAYVLSRWVPNEVIESVKNPHFWDAANVGIERIHYSPTQDCAAALARFRAGELDINIGVPPQEIGWLRQNLRGELHVAPFLYTQYLLFNVRRKPFDDLRVRTALSLAVDRDTLATRVMRAGERPAYAFVPPHMPFYPGTAALTFHDTPMPARRARARELLAAAGFGPGRPLSFDFNVPDTTDARLAAVALQSMWKEVAVEMRILPSDEKDHYDLLLKQEFSVGWAGWLADYRDARNFLLLGQTSSGDLNSGAYSNPRFDSLMDRSDRTADPHARGGLLAQAEQILLDDAAIVPLYFGVSRTLVSPAVRGWVDNEINVNRTRWLKLDRALA